MKDVNSMAEPISLPTFISATCRSLDSLRRVNLFFDVQLSVPDLGSIPQLGECLVQNASENLPDSIRLSLPLPAGCRLGLVVRDMGDNTLQILKVISCQSAMSAKDAAKFCRGDAYAMVFRPGPWALKKAVFSLIDRLPGYHATWFSLTQNMSAPHPRRAQSSQWAPPDDELLAAIEYINQNAPECDSQNQQYYWILCNIKEDAGSPISGWPEAKVRIMAQNKAKGMAGAQLETDFPLHTYSLKPFLAEKLLPLLYPLFMNFAFMFLGWPGVGKTPAIIIMMLAMGRYHASRLDLPTPPGWRRAKSLDNFRHRVGNIHEGVFLDDPSREKIDLADLKSFVTAEENQTCHGRYNDVKLAKNCCRAYAANDIQEEDEPKDEARLHRLCITMEEFLKLLRRTFPGDKPADIRAVLKRTVVFIVGQSALYLRLPSQKDDAPIHRIEVEDIHQDLLAEHDNLWYGKYKSGESEKPPGYEDGIAKEQSMLSDSMNKYVDYASPQDYFKEVNDKLYDLLLEKQPFPARAWLPSSPESASPERPALIYKDPLPGTVPNRLVKFHYPPKKRLRCKAPGIQTLTQATSSVPVPSAMEALTALVEDADADLLAMEAAADLVGLDFSADEEAATFMDSWLAELPSRELSIE